MAEFKRAKAGERGEARWVLMGGCFGLDIPILPMNENRTRRTDRCTVDTPTLKFVNDLRWSGRTYRPIRPFANEGVGVIDHSAIPHQSQDIAAHNEVSSFIGESGLAN